jgi:hypothetical protein
LANNPIRPGLTLWRRYTCIYHYIRLNIGQC